jgi:hypothetical protein
MILSEGAGAILLAAEGPFTIECAHPGGYFTRRAEAKEILKRILSDLSQPEVDLVISSANGTFVDHAESKALEEVIPETLVYTGKPALGESVGAAGSVAFCRASACAARRSRRLAAAFGFTHNSGKRAPRNCSKLWTQSASGRITTGSAMTFHAGARQ